MNFAQPVTKINTEIWMLHWIIGAKLVVTIQTNIVSVSTLLVGN